MIQGQFTDTKDMYKYLFENCDNCEELTSFLEDYFDEMRDALLQDFLDEVIINIYV